MSPVSPTSPPAAIEDSTKSIGPLLHELRTPLNAICGFAQLLELDDRLDAEQRDNVEEILGAARRMVSLLDRAAAQAG